MVRKVGLTSLLSFLSIFVVSLAYYNKGDLPNIFFMLFFNGIIAFDDVK